MKHLFLLIFILFSLGQLGRISFLNQQINWYLYEATLLIGLCYLFLKFGIKPLAGSFFKYKIIFIFLSLMLFSYGIGLINYNRQENLISFLYFLRLTFYFLFLFYLSYFLEREKKAVSIVKNGLTIFITITVISSFVQYFLYPDLRNILYAGWDPHLYRLFGLFLDTSVAGALYGLVFLFVLLSGKKIIQNTLIRKMILVIFLICIVLTFSRSLYIAIFVTTIVATAAQKWYRELLILVCLFFLFLFIAPTPSGEGVNLMRIFSIQSRFNDYKGALKIWQKNPITGIGYNRIRYAKIITNKEEKIRVLESHSGASFHSSYLIILVTTGLVGLVLFLGVLYKLSETSHLARYITLFIGVLSISDNIFLHPFVLFLYLTIISLSTNLSDKKR